MDPFVNTHDDKERQRLARHPPREEKEEEDGMLLPKHLSYAQFYNWKIFVSKRRVRGPPAENVSEECVVLRGAS